MNKEQKSEVALREEDTLTWWKEQRIFERSIEQRVQAESYVFYEGPPTANAKPALHHMLARAYKDVIIRYKTMQGFEVKRRAGWDTHGLPVEVQVEKAEGLKNKKDIELLVPGDRLASINKFNQLCRDNVWSNIQDWEYFTERMGYWLDFSNAYITYHKDYVESLWGIIKRIYNDGRLVKSHKVVPFCTRCGTPLSSHEVAQEYHDVVDRTVYVLFAVADESDTYFVAWTTTPWTLPGNVGLAVGANIEYVKATDGSGRHYYLAKELVTKVLGKAAVIETEVEAKTLIGKKYLPVFEVPVLQQNEQSYRVIEAPFVTTAEGTGIVHTAAMYGAEDYEVAIEAGLPCIHTVNEDGTFASNVAELAGQSIEEATPTIIETLKSGGSLLKMVDYKHSYPFCWRCKSKLIYYAKDSWFVTMSSLKEELMAVNEQVNWVPEHIKHGRFGEWLKDLRDWSFSRDRYWGTPLPVWTNAETGQHIVVASIEELRQQAVDPNMVPADFDPHRPAVDAVVLKDQEGREYHFEEVICDVWFDSGAMPFASGEDAAGRYPAQYISEAIDQTRGWFYTLQAVAVLMGKKQPAYENVICLGHINDEHGKKMSKSLGNIIDPMTLGDRFGMDAVRFYLYTINQPGLTKRFSEKDLLTSWRKNQQLLENVLSFYQTYKGTAEAGSSTMLDEWIRARYWQVVQRATNYLDDYNITDAARLITELIADLSQWYLRRSRERKTTAFFDTLKETLKGIALILAPFTPFGAEHIWRELRSENEVESVHLANWPANHESDEILLKRMETIRKIVEGGHMLRQAAKIKVRQPLSCLSIKGFDLGDEEQQLVLAELNLTEIAVVSKLPDQPRLDLGADFSISLDITITAELRKQGDERELIRSWQDARRQQELKPGETAKLIMNLPIGFDAVELAELARRINLVWESGEAHTYRAQLNNQEITFELV